MAQFSAAGLIAKPERLLWAVAVLGIVFRIRAIFEGRSLWLDETFLVMNLLRRDFWQLLTIELSDNQSAPPGFLALSWAAFHLLGQTDFSVRFVPLIAGSLVPLIAVLAARSVFTGWLARFTFVGLASFSPVLIFYSGEFKQYSIDVLATMFVIYWWANWSRLKRSRSVYVIGALLALCSLTAVLMLVLLCLILLWQAIRRDSATKPWRETFFGEFSPALIASWSAAMLIHAVQALMVTPAGFMLLWWSGKDAFAPLPTSVDSLLWYPLSFIKLFHLAFTTSASAGPSPDLGWPIVWVAGLIVVGLAVRLRSKWLVLPAVALVAAYLLATLRLYPFSSRLALYLLPLLFLVLALAVEKSTRMRWRNQLFLVAIPLATMLAVMGAFSAYRWVFPLDYRDTKWALSAVAANAKPDQILALDPMMVNQVAWYKFRGEPIPIDSVAIPWSWEVNRFTDVSALINAPGVWTLTALGDEGTQVELRDELNRLGFVTVCYVFEDITSVALHVPVELAESQQWECTFPIHN